MSKLTQLIAELGNHSLTVSELRSMLAFMQPDRERHSEALSARLLVMLQTMCERDGPVRAVTPPTPSVSDRAS